MHSRMEEEMRKQQGFQQEPKPQSPQEPKSKAGDYIDFEEVKQ